MADYLGTIAKASEYLVSRGAPSEALCIVLGSGWGSFADQLEGAIRVPYREVPGFPTTGVHGHKGEWIFGTIGDKPVILMSGRFHAYEGHDLKTVTLPIRVIKALNARALVLTNAAGGVNAEYDVGDLMLLTDHINMTGLNPLTGSNHEELGVRFPDMTGVYTPALREVALEIGLRNSLPIRQGVYAQMSGPSFETPAEIRMLRALGADAVGMSTVPEAIVARHGGMEVLGISCIANKAAGITGQPLSHAEVMEAGRQSLHSIRTLLTDLAMAV